MFNDDERCRNNEEMTENILFEERLLRAFTICHDDEQSVKAKPK